MSQPLVPASLPAETQVERLPNGLTVGLLVNRQAPIVTSALWYRVGTRDEAPGRGGAAHFLEHMMFKGSRHYGPGEIDRRTQALGGANNAFTSHDSTAYYFNFARDRWREALAIEADRMAGLRLDPDEVASERQVILEEVAMYEDDPWDALGRAIEGELFRGHPYGLPVLGTRPELEVMGADELGGFHGDFYRPDNAVLVLAGDLPEDALAAVGEAFAEVAAGAKSRPELAAPEPLEELVRVERHHGELARLQLAFRVPAANHRDHPALRLLAALLGTGRASRLQRALVDDGQLCGGISVGLGETLDTGPFLISAEVLPGVEVERVEEVLLAELERLRREVPPEEELDRLRRVVSSDWVFAHERVHQQALAAGFELANFERGHLDRQMTRLLANDGDRLRRVAERYLVPENGAVLGLSLPNGAAA
ncbi:MAG: pitrilysin family protein [Acidobacteriota bacterium]